MNKKDLREKYKKIRNDIENKELKSKIITDKIINSEIFNESEVVALYSNLPSEVDTTFLINNSLNKGKIVLLPKVIDKFSMEFYKIESIKDLNVGSFGIKEPNNINKISREDIDLIIVPGICFDNSFNRIGFGKGYYDKYLYNDNKIIKIGICFDEQILANNSIETTEFDIKMDMILTDKNTLIYKKIEKNMNMC